MGWGEFFGAIGKLLGKIPIQDRKERWKNELDNLKKEKESLLRSKCNEKNADRFDNIDKRIDYLNQLLKNSSDSD